MNDMESRKKLINSLIAKNEINMAIHQLSVLLKNSEKTKELTIQSARYMDITEQVRLGVISTEEAEVTKNKIRLALLDLLSNTLDFVGKDSDSKMNFEHLTPPAKNGQNVSQLIDTGDSFVNEQIFNKSRFTDRIQASIFSHISGKKINIYNGLVFIFLITLVLIFLFKANRGIVGISGYNNDNNKIEIGK